MLVMNSNTPSNTPIVKHLDSEYRRRWEKYYTSDDIYDSREINWRDFDHTKVTKIEANIEGHIYIVDNSNLIRWRFAGQEWINGVLHKIDIWCIGYHDGITCFMKEIQFKDGSMKETQYPLEEYKRHL